MDHLFANSSWFILGSQWTPSPEYDVKKVGEKYEAIAESLAISYGGQPIIILNPANANIKSRTPARSGTWV